MKKIMSFFLALVLGIIPAEAFAYHEHYFEFIVSQQEPHPHKAIVKCDCGKSAKISDSYMFDCNDCLDRLCIEHDVHSYLNITKSGKGWIKAECDCGELEHFDTKSEWQNFSDETELYIQNFCDELTVQLANESQNRQETVDIDSLFSKNAANAHPHTGFYETRDGNEVYLEHAFNGKCKKCIEQLCYEYGAHSCLSDYKKIDGRFFFICFCGKEKKVSFNRLGDFLEDRRQDNIDICTDITFDLADEVYYNAKNQLNAYEDSEHVYEQAESTLGGIFRAPQVYPGGKVSITADITSNYDITSIYVYVTNSNGATVSEAQINPNSKNVVISENSDINKQLGLEKLPTGTYNIFIEITDSSGTTGNSSAEFNLTQNNCSTLKIDFTRVPAIIKEQGSFVLRGAVSSNYNITEVYGYIKDSYGNIVDSSRDFPSSTYMDINPARLNHDLNFGSLSDGNYKIVAIARDTSGAEVTLEHSFTVARSGSASGNNTTLVDGIYTVNEWNELFGHIIYYSDFEPCYMQVATPDATVHVSALDASAVVGHPAQNTTLTVISKCSNKYNNVWYLVEYNGVIGYIWSGDLKLLEIAKVEEDDLVDKILNGTSDVLTIISLIPAVDTISNILQIPVDMLREDWVSVGLSLGGVVPILGETADTTKMVRFVDNYADTIKTAKKADKINDTAKVANKFLVNKIDDVIYDANKIDNYLLNLNHTDGKSKAKFFKDVLGYSNNDSKLFFSNLVESIKNKAFSSSEITQYGTKYTFDTKLLGKNGKTANITVIIQKDNGTDFYRLITAYPRKR